MKGFAAPRKIFAVALLAAALFAPHVTCAARARQAPAVRALPSPAGTGSGQSNLSTGPDGRVYLSWIDRLEEKRFALRFARREGAGWSAARTIAEGSNWFINWADFPSLIALPDGSLAAHWLVRSGAGIYAYDVNISRSQDGGKTWSQPTVPHRDGTQTEHGFVSMFPAGGALLGAVWLDGREMKAAGHGGGGSDGDHGHGQMTLRYATLGPGGAIASETVLDGRVCECCQTSAALTSEGVVVVYRDRSAEEVRDIGVVRFEGGRWSEPRPVHTDGWRIEGCPVNGPSVAASGRRVAVAWFTMGGGSPHVRLAFSEDAGATFKPPVEIGDGDPVGRADVLLLEDGGAVVCWLERSTGGTEIRARRVNPDGTRGPSITIAPSDATRSSGFPQMARSKEMITFSWTSPAGVRTAEMPAPRQRN